MKIISPCLNLGAALSILFAGSLRAELTLPAIIGDHMVLQQKQANPIWGWDTPGTEVTVTFGDQVKKTTAAADGKWAVSLDPVTANATTTKFVIAGTSTR